ncbi:Xanthine dehydrogenase [Hibiscus syriacus]|uniref:Xanthine dehydrogenase n=1 Tax=Hibiscus syriacus TaxID=106335 RepID=A0A6A2XG92_HIBSY|nr:Xanthine dehydrogenase [Hibiscus syriacus]
MPGDPTSSCRRLATLTPPHQNAPEASRGHTRRCSRGESPLEVWTPTTSKDTEEPTATESKETATENKDERRKTKEDRKLPTIPINNKPNKKKEKRELTLPSEAFETSPETVGFRRFFLWVSHQIEGKKSIKESVPLSHLSAIKPFHRPPLVASQDYEIRKHGTSVGSPEVHLSSRLQVTGEAECDDTPMPPNALHAALVLSKKPHARILSINELGAKFSHGFAGIFFAKDISGSNKIGPIILDEELFASEFVTCVGQVIGIVVADTHENAKLAAGKDHVEQEELPAILSIEDAIGNRGESSSGRSRTLLHGDTDQLSLDHGQWIGGAFGGKETRSAFIAAAAAAVPSYLMNKPVKLKLDRDTNMITTGQRHGFLGKFKSPAVLEHAMFHSDNVYEIPNVRISGNVFFTNFPSNTAFRGLGAPQLDSKNCFRTQKESRRDQGEGSIMQQSTIRTLYSGSGLERAEIMHGGVEMGQGLHTKVDQVAASSFNIPLSSVFISDTSTDKVPNAAPTAASVSSDMYAAATLDTCEQIKARMEPIASQRNYTSFAELVTACYLERIDLSAHGFYITPDIGFDWSTVRDRDSIHKIAVALPSDIPTIAPAIAAIVVEGAFIQGLGLPWKNSSGAMHLINGFNQASCTHVVLELTKSLL